MHVTGHSAGSLPPNGAIHATPVVSDGRVYVATLDGAVHALQ
jgi:outer membrane protein assembly factor BamB